MIGLLVKMTHFSFSTKINKQLLVTSLIILFALFIRLWGVTYSLPYLYHPDEPSYFDTITSIVKNEQYNPSFYYFPSLFFYIQALFYKSAQLFSQTLNCCGYQTFPTITVISGGNGYVENPTPFYVSRLLTIFFSLVTGVLVFILTKIISRSIKAAAISAIIFAISPISIENSRFITLDSYVAFFAMATLLVCILLYKTGAIRWYILAGFLAGLTAATKYNGGLVISAVILAHFFRTGIKGMSDQRLYYSIFFSLFGFLIGTPGFLTYRDKFIEGFKFQFNQYSTGFAGAESNSLFFYVKTLLIKEPADFIFAILGLFLVGKKNRKEVLIIGIFVALYILFLGLYEVHFERHLTLVIGPMSVVASLFLIRFISSKLRSTLILLIIFLVSLSFIQSIQTSIDASQDKRASARIWIDKNIPSGSDLAIEAYGPWVNTKKYQIVWINSLIDYPVSWYLKSGIDYVIVSENMFGRFYKEPRKYPHEISQYEAYFRTFKEVARFNDYGYQIKIHKVRPI